MLGNPFTPTFGTVPAILAGRDEILADYQSFFSHEPNSPNKATIFIGARGTGKTALLSSIGALAAEEGWITASTSETPGMLEDVLEQAQRAGCEIIPPEPDRRMTSATLGPLSATWDNVPKSIGNWRTRMTDLIEQLNERDTGLLITVDEVRSALDEMVRLVTCFQHFVSERRKVALAMAGLPYHIHKLVSGESTSFVRRSMQYRLSSLPDSAVESAFRKTIEDAGGHIQPDALAECVTAIEGFPYMLQLVGYRAWEESGGQSITRENARNAIATAQKEFEERIIEATVRELSDRDLQFLGAMLEDDRESRLGDIADRMGVKPSYATKYKSRLLNQGVIDEPARGRAVFAIPGLRAYLEHELSE